MSNQKLSILMLTANYLPETFGGAERQCQKLSKELVLLGYKVSVLSSRSKFSTPFRSTIDGVTVIRPFTFAQPQVLSIKTIHATIIWFVYVGLWMLLRRKSYDVVHIHQIKFQAYVGLLLAKLLQKRSIIKAGNSGENFDLLTLKRKKIVGKWLYSFVIRNADIAIAISTDIEAELEEHGIAKPKIRKIPNGVEIDLDSLPSTQLKNRYKQESGYSDTTIFLFVGRLEKQKDFKTLLRAFKDSDRNGTNAKLLLLGEGSFRSAIELQIRVLGLEEDVILVGYKKDISSYLIGSDFLILSTHSEGLSNALMEAMSYGLIPISTRVSGSTDLIDHEVNGYLAEPGSSESLAGCIEKATMLTPDSYHSMAELCFKKMLNSYDIRVIAEQYDQLYFSFSLR